MGGCNIQVYPDLKQGPGEELGSDLRMVKTRAIFPTARILFRMTSLRVALAPPAREAQRMIPLRDELGINRVSWR